MVSLAVKHRPKTFDEITGQDSIVKILSKQLQTNSISHSYLFCGPSGVGKTTTARAFAYKLNEYTDSAGNICSSEPIEIDAASNNGIDNIREIIDNATQRSIDGKYKVFIIDEVHGLSNSAWQALLKTIEEPPTYSIFILCTTDPQKIPATILSRCMRFNFCRIPSNVIFERLMLISKKENYYNYEAACDYISKNCSGQMRDAIALLEKCSAYSTDLSIDNVLTALGNFSYSLMFELVNAIIDANAGTVLQIIDKIYYDGGDLKLFVEQFFAFIIDVSKYNLFHSCDILQIPKSYQESLEYTCKIENAGKFFAYYLDNLLELKNMLKTDPNPKNTITVILMKITRCN